MSGSPWVWVVVGAAVVALLGSLRWALADFLLDEFGWLTDSRSKPVSDESHADSA